MKRSESSRFRYRRSDRGQAVILSARGLREPTPIWGYTRKKGRFGREGESCYTWDSSLFHLLRREAVQRQERAMQKYKVSIEYCVQ